MRFSVSAEVAAPVDQVWAWWTDYGEAGTEEKVHHGFGAMSLRRVLVNEGRRVVLDERMPVGGALLVRHEMTLDAEERVIQEADSEGRFLATWTFEATPSGGTRITRVIVSERGAASLLPAWVARPFVLADLRFHARDAERALRRR